jgi:hypothetical protein
MALSIRVSSSSSPLRLFDIVCDEFVGKSWILKLRNIFLNLKLNIERRGKGAK